MSRRGSALGHRLLEHGDNPNDWTVSYVQTGGGTVPVPLAMALQLMPS